MAARDEQLQQLFENMQSAQRLMQHYFMCLKQELGLSPAQMHVLFIIKESQPLSFKELASKLGLTPGAVTQLVDALFRQQYVERVADEHDRRVACLSLSPTGLELFTKLEKRRNELLTNIMSSLTGAELEQLTDMYKKMTAYLEDHNKTHRKDV